MLSIIESLALLREAKTTSVDLIAKCGKEERQHVINHRKSCPTS